MNVQFKFFQVLLFTKRCFICGDSKLSSSLMYRQIARDSEKVHNLLFVWRQLAQLKTQRLKWFWKIQSRRALHRIVCVQFHSNYQVLDRGLLVRQSPKIQRADRLRRRERRKYCPNRKSKLGSPLQADDHWRLCHGTGYCWKLLQPKTRPRLS